MKNWARILKYEASNVAGIIHGVSIRTQARIDGKEFFIDASDYLLGLLIFFCGDA